MLNGISVKRFPDAYIVPGTSGDSLILPRANEISMYRELEGVYLLLDGSRIFFNSQQQAKYAFYSALNGATEITVPESQMAARIVRSYLHDLQEIYVEIRRRIESMGCEDESLFSRCLKWLEIPDLEENP